MQTRLLINEIFHSVQGESSRAGLPCVFVRLRGCHLRCTWCDTEYAFSEGSTMQVDDIVNYALQWDTPLVQITGGEPLLQEAVHPLMSRLCDAGKTVLLETSGACDISACDDRVIRIMDLKCPGSGEADRNDFGNIAHLRSDDEVKFVIGDREDYEWARGVIETHQLTDRVSAVLLSPVHAQKPGKQIDGHAGLEAQMLAEWMLQDQLSARLQLQMHKVIWHPERRGV
ncbi:MAG: radical SAM protein [Phycisphaerales bacterium]|jgi:7-carboxy-7-deazaguanine synthase|nr:radical SAM protein [Phycisphaerales bacterium]